MSMRPRIYCTRCGRSMDIIGADTVCEYCKASAETPSLDIFKAIQIDRAIGKDETVMCVYLKKEEYDRITTEVEQLKKELAKRDKAIDKAVETLANEMPHCPLLLSKYCRKKCEGIRNKDTEEQCWRQYIMEG